MPAICAGVIHSMDLQLSDRVAVITGSSKGLGFAAASALASEGARVVICGRTADTLEHARVQLETKAPGRILAVRSDVATPDGCTDLVSRAVDRFGRIDILINNVGKAGGGDIVSTLDAEWQ